MEDTIKSGLKDRITEYLGMIEDVIYIVLVILLVAVAILVLIASIEALIHAVKARDLISGVIEVIDKILLALMVVEILYTITLSFKSHALLPGPFLVVALIASVRRILLISLEAAHPSTIESATFHNYMIELGVLGLLIAVFVLSLWIIGKTSDKPVIKQTSIHDFVPKEEK